MSKLIDDFNNFEIKNKMLYILLNAIQPLLI